MIRQPPKVGAIWLHHEPESFNISHADVTATTFQGITSRGPYQLEGARWHLLTKIFNPESLKFDFHSEILLQERLDEYPNYRSFSWQVLARLPKFLELKPTLAGLVSRPLPSFPMHEEERRLRGGCSVTVQSL